MRRLAALLVLLTAFVLLPSTSTVAVAPAASSTPTSDIWVFGDSIAAGSALQDPVAESWPSLLDAQFSVAVRNYAIGGQAIAYDAGSGRMDEMVKSYLILNPDTLPSVVILAGGINDFIRSADVGVGDTRWAVANLHVWLATYFPRIQFYVMTTTPYRSDSTFAPELSMRRDNYNTWVRASFGPTNQLIDSGDLLTAGVTYADIRYYSDSLHPDAEGSQIIADGVQKILAQRGID